MKIRRKAPKVSPRTARPLYIVGYPGTPPSPAELQGWFDLEYGGPLRVKEDARASPGVPPAPAVVTHGPWDAAVIMALPPSEADSWKEQLAWSHSQAGCIIPTAGTPGKALDLVLHAARLARGLVLLTDGTAYDLVTATYLNPSDWTDRRLDQFVTADHITVSQADSHPEKDWFYTKGLSKFGLDELETFRPKGLPARSVLESLAAIAEAILLSGRSPNVGASVPLESLGLTVTVQHHRTASPSNPPLTLREISWQHIDKPRNT